VIAVDSSGDPREAPQYRKDDPVADRHLKELIPHPDEVGGKQERRVPEDERQVDALGALRLGPIDN